MINSIINKYQGFFIPILLVVVIFIGIVVLNLTGRGSAFGKLNWYELTIEDEGFSIQMPFKPEWFSVANSQFVFLDQYTKTDYYASEHDRLEYVVGVTKLEDLYDPSTFDYEMAMLDNIGKERELGTEMRVARLDVFEGLPGYYFSTRLFLIDQANSYHTIERSFFLDGSLVTLIAVGPSEVIFSEDSFNKFFESFQVVDKKSIPNIDQTFYRAMERIDKKGYPQQAITDENLCSSILTESIESSQFVIHYSGYDKMQMLEYLFLLEELRKYLGNNFFTYEVDHQLNVCVFDLQIVMNHFLKNSKGFEFEVEGAYIEGENALYVYRGTGLGTIAHELAHPMFANSVEVMPAWAIEGIPSFFEKFYANKRLDGDEYELEIIVGFQNPWRVKEVLDFQIPTDLNKIIKSTIISGETSTNRLLALFLFRQGKLKEYIDSLALGDKGEYSTHIEAALGQGLEEIETKWDAFIDQMRENEKEIMQIPSSSINDNNEGLEKFMERLELYNLQTL